MHQTRRVDNVILNPLKRGGNRPKRTLSKVIESNLLINNLFKCMVFDRGQCHCAILVVDPTKALLLHV